MALDPKRLIELLRIAECGSYTRAAASLGVSQPALSKSIAVLEKSLGVRLLERTPRGATLTDHGRLLASHAEALQRLLSRADDDLKLKKLGMEGSLAVGISPIASVELVPNAIARLTQEAPNISVGIYERPDAELLSGLLRGEIDAVISPLGAHPRSPDIDCEVLLQDIAVVIVRPQNPIAQRNLVGIKELSEERWVMPSPHTAMWEHTRALFAAANVPWPANYITTNSITALTALVMRTDAISISSRKLMRLEIEAGYLTCIPLRKPFARDIALRTRRKASLTPITQRFVNIVRAVAKEMK
jgi:LysR family pca operon transcriptional activator